MAYDDGASGEDVYDVHSDHLATPRMITDDAGDVVWRSTPEAYGTATLDTGNTLSEEFNIRFPGQYHDDETGLHYNRFRYYDPTIGRYISEDPIGQAGGANLYLYSFADPVNGVDPLGLDSIFGNPVVDTLRRARDQAEDIAEDAAETRDEAIEEGLDRAQRVFESNPENLDLTTDPDRDAKRNKLCVAQWIADTAWCNQNTCGEENVACHVRAEDNLRRCNRGEPRLPRMP